MVSDRFLRCDFCGGVIRPKDVYFWDEDEDLNKCYLCDEADWESLINSLEKNIQFTEVSGIVSKEVLGR